MPLVPQKTNWLTNAGVNPFTSILAEPSDPAAAPDPRAFAGPGNAGAQSQQSEHALALQGLRESALQNQLGTQRAQQEVEAHDPQQQRAQASQLQQQGLANQEATRQARLQDVLKTFPQLLSFMGFNTRPGGQ